MAKKPRKLKSEVVKEAVATFEADFEQCFSKYKATVSGYETEAAVVLSKSLKEALKSFKDGNKDVDSLKALVTDIIKKEPLSDIEYVECYGLPGLYELDKEVKAPSLLALAVRFGKTRLIDNIILE